ncbi:MAG: hypothetical protein AVDCRST_MAG37-313 [uncultured Rubrobacteraceae bacterium]|uniref:Uncharacterized protein n=1 Tax=uncultured Rubrobacteraceae bacterium TaxID=349277 RepID=A0A6J4Q2Z8_9ACTN|nr:MAG: hypothetical protein AVDCRST_MAG37-313 [uncultured Rubrobacteraceae bacterium]
MTEVYIKDGVLPSPKVRVVDNGDLRKYRTEIPNSIFDMRLKPQEVALYTYLKRVCGARKGGRAT